MTERPAFELLHARLQRQLYAMKWPSLRPLQVHSIRSFTEAPRDLLLMAETAAGKTEAAFLPILSSIAHEPEGSIRALYVGPLKALINDQFARVEQLCTHLDMPVYRWHGDVGASRKEALTKRPGGVLLITPESLESLLINRTAMLPGLFGGLRAVVIDELHAFLGNERGRHLASLLSRLSRYRRPGEPTTRRIGLSATIGDPAIACAYLQPDAPDSVVIVRDDGAASEVRLRVHGFDRRTIESQHGEGDEEAAPMTLLRAMAESLTVHCAHSTNLVFANRKGDIELLADAANAASARSGHGEIFQVHHGSLARELREEAEQRMRGNRPCTTICSSTLEMGIDVGRVRMVGQVGAPWSVASLKQRMGRSGRAEGEPRRLRCYVDCTRETDGADLAGGIPLELLQTIAVCELMLEGWVEPPQTDACDLSTLTHQVISTIAELGSATAEDLYRRLCREGAFRSVDSGLFARLLRALGARDVLEQGADGHLILGLHGESLRTSRDFYAVFHSPHEYTLRTNDRVLGTLPLNALPEEGENLIFAARRWAVVRVDAERSEILVEPAMMGDRPRFRGDQGTVHQTIVDRMMNVLSRSDNLPWLDDAAADALQQARLHAQVHGLARHRRFALTDKITYWANWSGTTETRTYGAWLHASGVQWTHDGIGFTCTCTEDVLESLIEHARRDPPDIRALARQIEPKCLRVYDELLPDELLEEAIATTLSWSLPKDEE